MYSPLQCIFKKKEKNKGGEGEEQVDKVHFDGIFWKEDASHLFLVGSQCWAAVKAIEHQPSFSKQTGKNIDL